MRLSEPGFADGFVGSEAFEGLRATAEVVGGDEIGEVLPQLIVVVVVVSLDGRILDRPVHPLDLPICLRVPRFGEAVLDVVVGAQRPAGQNPPTLPDIGRCR